MSCFSPSLDGPAGISDVLRTVDCQTGEVTRQAFERIFGGHGTLDWALTAILTIYVALLAVNLLTGRSTLRLSLLSPKALTIGLVLTFATSWVAYQQVVWNLAAGAPDQIAGILIGSHGSAVHLFASQLDKLFMAVTEAAKASGAAMDAAHKGAPFAPSDLLWSAAVLLLLGTAGTLIVARIALAAMLAIGPLFIVLALFEGSRGLFEGWLKAVVLFALIPLITVLVGGGALLLLDPMIQSLTVTNDVLSMQLALGVLMGSCVYTALMIMAVKAAALLTSSIHLPRGNSRSSAGASAPAPQPVQVSPGHPSPAAQAAARDERIRQLVAATQWSASMSSSRTIERGHRTPAFPYTSGKEDRGSHHERLRGFRTSRPRKEYQS